MHVTNEFSFLAEQARRLGVGEPAVHRVNETLPDGRQLSALRFGDGGPLVTLLHGAGLNAHTWDTTVLALGLDALTLDLPGHGDSSWREDADYRAATLAPDVATALRTWTDRPQVLVGHSLGGLTAASVAAEHPELVSALVLVDIAPGIDMSAGPSALREFFSVIDFASRDEMVERAMSFGLGGDRADTERGVFHNSRIRPDGRAAWKHHFAHLAHSALAATGSPEAEPLSHDTALWSALERVQAPLTLVRGTRGYVNEAAAQEFARRLPHARVVEIEAGHNIQENDPAALARLIGGEAAAQT